MNGASGHCETLQKLPEPLQSEGFFSIGTWALPAALLSAASLCIFIVALVFLQRNAQLRTLFRLELGNLCADSTVCPIIIATLTALLAWTIVVICRRRPGHIWPRLWALFLALLTTGVAIGLYSGVRPGLVSLLHAMAVACLAATLTLTPRLWRLHPDSPWVQRVAPISLLFVLLVILPVTYSMGRATVENQKIWLQERVENLRRQTRELQKCSATARGCSESRYRTGLQALVDDVVRSQPLWDTAKSLNQEVDIDRAAGDLLDTTASGLSGRLVQQIRDSGSTDTVGAKQKLDSLGVVNFRDFQELLPIAVTLGKVQTAKQAYSQLVDAVADGLAPENTPKLDQSPVVYDGGRGDDGPWPPNPEFAAASQRVVGYYRHLSHLFRELGDVVDKPALASLRDDYRQRQQQWQKRLENMKNSWAEHWLVDFMEPEQPAEPGKPSLAEVLAMPVIGNLAAANLAGLLELGQEEADRLFYAKQASNCERVDNDNMDKEKHKFSLRCRAYAPGPTPEQTTLWVELRLIYEGRRLTRADKPDRLYFFFPVPPDKAEDAFKEEVKGALEKARSSIGNKEVFKRRSPPVEPEGVDLKKFAEGQQYVKIVIHR